MFSIELLGLILTLVMSALAGLWWIVRYVDSKIANVTKEIDEVKTNYAKRDELVYLVSRLEGQLSGINTVVTDRFARLDQRIDDWMKTK